MRLLRARRTSVFTHRPVRRKVYQKAWNPKYGRIEFVEGRGYRWTQPSGASDIATDYAEARLTLIEPHLRRICAVALRRWGADPVDVEAATQAGIIAVWEALRIARDPTPRGLNDSYLTFRARRFAESELARQITRVEARESALQEVRSGDAGARQSEHADPYDLEGEVIGSVIFEQILNAVMTRARSPEDYRRMLLALAAGTSQRETGVAMGVSKQAVQDRLGRIRSWLHEAGLTYEVLSGDVAHPAPA